VRTPEYAILQVENVFVQKDGRGHYAKYDVQMELMVKIVVQHVDAKMVENVIQKMVVVNVLLDGQVLCVPIVVYLVRMVRIAQSSVSASIMALVIT
jgi:hypothetical protein